MSESNNHGPNTAETPNNSHDPTSPLALSASNLSERNRLHAHFVQNLPSFPVTVRPSSGSLHKPSGVSVNLSLLALKEQVGDGDSGRQRLTSNLSAISAAQCRICFSASGDTLTNGPTPTLIHPCACDGSIRFCHPECLLQWVRQSGSFVCELCKTRYRIRRNGLKNIRQWRAPTTDSIDWIHIVIFFFSVCFIVGSIIWMTWLGLGQRMSASSEPPSSHPPTPVRAEESASSLGDFMVPAFILYSIIDILFLFIAGMELIFTISPLVRKWNRMNQTLTIENYPERGSPAPPRPVEANVIAAAAAIGPEGSATMNLQASIPCVNEERAREAAGQNHIL